MRNTNQYPTIIALMVGLTFLYFIFDAQPALWIAAALGCITLIFPYCAQKIASAWQTVIHAVGSFLSFIMLTIVFYGILTPLAMVSRLFAAESPLQLSKKLGGTYYILRNHRFSAPDFEKLW